MTRLVSEYAHALGVVTAFDFEHLLTLEFHEPWVCEIKRDCNARNSVRGEPLFGQPNVGLEANSPAIELAVKALDVRLKKRTFYLDGQVANPKIE